MRKSIAAVASALAVVGGLSFVAPSASAASCSPGPTSPNTPCDVTVTGVVGTSGLTGVRTIGAVAPVALAGTSSLTGAIAVPVVETTALGVNPWSVTAVGSALTSGANSIPASNLSVSDTALPTSVGCLLLGCSVTSPGGTRGNLSTTQTLFSVTGESAATAYTGTYTYAGTVGLNVPNGTPTGTYSGTITLTLVQ